MSSTTPTIRIWAAAPLFGYQSRYWPTALAAPKYLRATLRVITTTGGDAAESAALNSRPSRTGTPTAVRYPELTERTSGRAGSARISSTPRPGGTNVPTLIASSMRMPARVKPADGTLGVARGRASRVSVVSGFRAPGQPVGGTSRTAGQLEGW